jgi:hypothetical protein
MQMISGFIRIDQAAAMDKLTMAHRRRRHAFQCGVSGALDCPFIVLPEQDSTDEADDGGFVGEDADDLCAELDLAVEAFEGIGGK